jgi:TrmH family RNA methyltransferase
MLSKAQNKYIRSLSQQKYRKEYNVFIVEGDKIAREWLASDARIKTIAALGKWITENGKLIENHPEAEVLMVTEDELNAISMLSTANMVLLVVERHDTVLPKSLDGWAIALDNIQDPGNMGTIIRIADWYGIKHIFSSQGSVDVYNPKVVQAAMGGHLRVQTHTVDLQTVLPAFNQPIYAALLDGEDIYSAPKAERGIIAIGNESAGLSPEVTTLATHRVMIPRIGGAESLNAAVSTGIICALLVGN